MPVRGSKTRAVLKALAQATPPSRFLDYKDLLKSLHDQMVRNVGKYTYHQFSNDLGLDFDNAAYIIMHSIRRLNRGQARTIATSLGYTGSERRYLLALLEFTDSEEQNRKALLQDLIDIKGSASESPEQRGILQFFSEWHHSIIFELVGLEDFQSDPKWIADRFHKRISIEQVKRSMQLLESLKLIRYDTNLNRHVKNVNTVSTGDDVQGLAIAGYHMQMLELAQGAMSSVPHQEREFGSMTLSVTDELLQRLKDDIRLFRKYVLFLAEQCKKPDQIVQLNVQMFSFTKVFGE